ncbi:histidine phosphotransferase [Altererythrobacter salegens]|uniref:Histidine phosphotransferase n=1 Tax=Croceibacterium salegens TaxID=1737568 RepID=A0A6I4SUT9_9SPHN|nr:histidine phosphotransferase family protein [Croceibacterium salegens]MXO58142.1 histidine phosphotransferase [Croceibacterium salegens]
MPETVDLASLLCSRLCHDMLSPVGALSNGIELLRDERDPEMRQRCMELLEQSARISADKLKFFRLAYGAAGGFGDAVPTQEPRDLVQGLVGDNGRIALQWAVGDPELPKPAVKVLLNLAAIGIDSLPRGGQLDVGAEKRDGATEIAVRAAGDKIAFDKSIGMALDGSLPPEALSGRTAPAHMIRLIADRCGGGVQYALSDEALVMGAILPDV